MLFYQYSHHRGRARRISKEIEWRARRPVRWPGMGERNVTDALQGKGCREANILMKPSIGARVHVNPWNGRLSPGWRLL